jgi:proline dehydrogenase
MDLIRSYVVFKSCRIPVLVKYSEPILRACYRYLGETITSALLKLTFFGHFCAGVDAEDIRPTVTKLERSGVGSILDYAAEADVEEQPVKSAEATNASPTKGPMVQGRTYEFETEEVCDQHAAIFESCIRAVKAVSPTGFAAIKITALGDPKLLERMSTAITELHNLFTKFDVEKKGKVTREQFASAYDKFFVGGEDVQSVFDRMDSDRDGDIDYVEWTNSLVVEDLHQLTSHCRVQAALAKATLTLEEREMVKRMRARVDRLASLAEELGVRVMIDAEHSYFQPAIDNITVDLQKRHNKKYPAVFGTYQLYLRDSQRRLFTDLDRARKGNYKFALKIVRGAYMVMERQRAQQLVYEDIIHHDIEATHRNYNEVVKELLGRISDGQDIEVMLATHNQESIERAVSIMQSTGISPNKGVYFGQLLGMSDHLTFALGKSGYKAYKYVPYGRVKEVMPYLIRRAQENSGMLGGAINEIKLVKSELHRRLFVKK